MNYFIHYSKGPYSLAFRQHLARKLLLRTLPIIGSSHIRRVKFTCAQQRNAADGLGLGSGDGEWTEISDMSIFQASQHPERTAVSPLVSTVDAIRTNSNRNETAVVIHEAAAYPDYLPQLSTAESDLHLTQPSPFTVIPTTQVAGSQHVLTAALPRASVNVNPPVRSRQNSEGRMICDRDECNNVTFHRKSAWE